MLSALWWWLVVQAVALGAAPLCLRLFAPLADRGYGLSKAFGLLLFGYLSWLIVVLHLLPNRPATRWREPAGLLAPPPRPAAARRGHLRAGLRRLSPHS